MYYEGKIWFFFFFCLFFLASFYYPFSICNILYVLRFCFCLQCVSFLCFLWILMHQAGLDVSSVVPFFMSRLTMGWINMWMMDVLGQVHWLDDWWLMIKYLLHCFSTWLPPSQILLAALMLILIFYLRFISISTKTLSFGWRNLQALMVGVANSKKKWRWSVYICCLELGVYW